MSTLTLGSYSFEVIPDVNGDPVMVAPSGSVPSIISGSGAPSGAPTYGTGSLYVDETNYVVYTYTASAWFAIKSITAAGSTGQIQYNSSGALAGATNVTINNSDLTLLLNASPVTPPANTVKLFGRSVASRMIPAFIDPTGDTSSLQPILARNKIGYWNPPGNATTVPGVFGVTAPTTTGTATARTVATTNIATRMRRLGYVSSATAGSLCYQYIGVAQFSAGSGTTNDGSGFFSVTRFVPSDGASVSGERFFCGFSSSTSAPTNVQPSTLTNCIGIAQLSTDATQFYLVYGGSSAQTAIAMGTALGAPNTQSTAAYEFAIYAPNATANTFYVQVTNLGTGATYTNTLSGGSAVIPQSGTLLAFSIWKTNNATATAVAYDLCSHYIETDN